MSDRRVNLRVTEEQYSLIVEKAKRSCMTISEFARQKIIEEQKDDGESAKCGALVALSREIESIKKSSKVDAGIFSGMESIISGLINGG